MGRGILNGGWTIGKLYWKLFRGLLTLAQQAPKGPPGSDVVMSEGSQSTWKNHGSECMIIGRWRMHHGRSRVGRADWRTGELEMGMSICGEKTNCGGGWSKSSV